MTVDVVGRLRNRLPQIAAVGARFPLAVVATLALALYLLFDLHRPGSAGAVREWWGVKIPVGLGVAALWAFGMALWTEARGTDGLKAALGIAGWCVIALLIALSRALDLEIVLVALALLAGLSVAAYLGRRGDQNGAFWLFNHELWSGAAAAFVAVVLSAGGVTAIIWTLDYLFGINLPQSLPNKVWIVATTVIGPIYWLSLVPRDLEARVAEGVPADFLNRAISVLSTFVVIPLLLVYAAILHAYAAKILLESSLPKGRLGWMVLSFGCAMALALLAAFPTRNSSGRHVVFFWRAWPYLLIVPLILLFVAVGARVRQYGLTEQRYMVALAGVWLALLALIYGFRRSEARNLALVPGLLTGLLLLASFGPWGMTGWSIRNQVKEFAARLAAAGLLKDGRIVPDARPTTTLLVSDRQRLHGIIDYLNGKGRLADLQPFFANDPQNPFGGASGTSARYEDGLAGRVRERIGIGRTSPAMGPQTLVFHGVAPTVVAIGNGARLVGPLTLSVTAGRRKGEQTYETPAGKIVVEFDQPTLSVTDVSGRIARFSLARLVDPAGPVLQPAGPGQPRTPIEIGPEPGPVKGRLVVLDSTARTVEGSAPELTHMRFWVVLDPGI